MHVSRLFSSLAVLALSASGTLAATFAPETDPARPARHLEDILLVDALGFECIAEADIDRAFHLTGKGLRLPRTCLPEPCTAALDRPRLATLIGRPPSEMEWDTYYARYAETCRRETIAFGTGTDMGSDTGTGDDLPRADDPERFWAPLATRATSTSPLGIALSPLSRPRGPGRAGLPLPSRTLTTGGAAAFPLGVPGRDGTDTVQSGAAEIAVTVSGGEGADAAAPRALPPILLSSQSAFAEGPPVIPSPIPGSALLLGAALGLAPILNRRRRRAKGRRAAC